MIGPPWKRWTWPIRNGKSVKRNFTDSLNTLLLPHVLPKLFKWRKSSFALELRSGGCKIYFDEINRGQATFFTWLIFPTLWLVQKFRIKQYRRPCECYGPWKKYILDRVSSFLNQELDPINSLWRVVSLASIHRPCNARRNRSDTFCDFIKFNQ